jgi:peptidoglycan/xylan/chitin deacetylase (PgdA/CDA1 family)/glycosyltransferase involved in cell wall biosynthesis
MEQKPQIVDVDQALSTIAAGDGCTSAEATRTTPVERAPAWHARQIVRAMLETFLPRKWFVVRGPHNRRSVYLTFDDGPHPDHTPRVLDALKSYGAKASFFVTGQNCMLYPDLIRRMVSEGHSIGHHSFSHSEPSKTSARDLTEELDRSDEAFRCADSSLRSHYFRPPNGKLSLGKLWAVRQHGLTTVLWNRDSKDYQARGAKTIREWAQANPFDSGDIVLMHDTNPHTPEALPTIIELVRSRGLYPDKIADLIAPNGSEGLSAAESIVCFAKDWEECPTSNNHVMIELAKTHRVLWFNSIATRTPRISSVRDAKKIWLKIRNFLSGAKRVGQNMWVYTPLVLPLPHSKFATSINEWLLRVVIGRLRRQLGMKEFQLWSFLPNVCNYLGKLGESLLVYYCVDDWSNFDYLNRERTLIEERRLVASADIVFATSDSLVADRVKLNRETHLARHGVDYDLFSTALDDKTQVPSDAAVLSKPLLGFFGTLQNWVDFGLIKHLAERHPEWSIVLIGPVLTDVSSVAGLPNVHLLGRRPHASLPNYCKAFSVGIIPYRVNQRVLHVNPLKMREYLAAGLPVISTALPEVQGYSRYCAIADTPAEFELAVESALLTDSPQLRRERSEAMRAETWEKASARLVEHVKRVVARKGLSR